MISNRFLGVVASALLLGTLTACGGGGGGGGGDSSGGSSSGSSGGGSSVASVQADAGPDQDVKTGTQVRLDGRASGNANSRLLQFVWKFVSRPDASQAQLDDRRRVTPAFTADVDGEYVVQLRVGKGEEISPPDTVTIDATPDGANSAPRADAGDDQSVATGLEVTLDGSASRDIDGDVLTYAWSFESMPDGSQTALVEASSPTPIFTPDLPGDYVLQLEVDDGSVQSPPDTVNVTAAQGNRAPIADAGVDRNTSVGATIRPDGSASSDADGDELNYGWRVVSRPVNSNAELEGANSVKPSLVADRIGDYLLALTVNDGTTDSAEDRLVVTAGPAVALFVDANQDGEPRFVPVGEFEPSTIQIARDDRNALFDRLQLRAIGRDFTIEDLQVETISRPESGEAVDLVFEGLSDPTTVTSGEPLTFNTVLQEAPPVGRYEVLLTFTVRETGRVFRILYRVNSR